MTVKPLLYVSVFALFSFNVAITEHSWSLLRIEDATNKRTIIPSSARPQLHFTKEHVYFKNCTEVSGRYSFARAFELQLNLDSIKDQNCTITERQINWYFKYRLKDVIYVLKNDTLQFRDKSGVNYVFLKDAAKK